MKWCNRYVLSLAPAATVMSDQCGPTPFFSRRLAAAAAVASSNGAKGRKTGRKHPGKAILAGEWKGEEL